MGEARIFLKEVISIPFKCATLESIVIIAQKIFSGLAPTLEMISIAEFLNKAIAIAGGNANYNEIYLPILTLVSVVAINWISEKLIGFVNVKLEIKLKKQYRVSITEKIAKLKYSYIENEESWNLISRVSKEPEIIIKNAFNSLLSMVALIVRIIGILGILFYYAWWAAIIILVLSLPLFILAIKGGKAIYEVTKGVAKERRKSDYIGLVLTNREFVDERTLFEYGEGLSNKWIGIYENVRKLEYKVQRDWNIKSSLGSLMTSMISIIILFIFLKPLEAGTITIGVFISIGYGVMDLIKDMSWRLSMLIEELTKNKEYFKEVSEFFALEEEGGAIDLPTNNVNLDSLEFKDVSFKYPGTDNYIFEDLSFKIEKGKHYAIVGANGSGKTTLTKLITGLYNEFDGDILVNGKSIKRYTQSELKGLTSVVYQDFAKYFVSVKDNIALGNINSMDDREFDYAIKDATKIIEIDEKINSLKKGINSNLGKLKKDSVDLSGGQWQRIAMARSIVSDAELRILDEPTSALDPVSESKVYENFEKISKNKTTIFISHRLGSTKLASEIFVIENGKLAEKGSHNELMELDGVYKNMYDSQKEWYAC
ncbi:MAG: ABC transporter ATP-binding protein [Clostridium sp.]|uniref:ABC transporter ATP-binding protein n=1 Tax=Clostridium sp. TaxID=1506 RepID=UPI003F3D91BD